MACLWLNLFFVHAMDARRNQRGKSKPGFTIVHFCTSSNLMKACRPDNIVLLQGKLFHILRESYLCLAVNILIFRPAQTEMVVGPHETPQMGQLVPYCVPPHPDGKMSQKCQGKPSWLHSWYSSVIHHWTTPKKRPNCPTLKYCHRLYIGTVAISQALVQYLILLLFSLRL